MTEHFLTYEQSLAVEELGFDESCFGLYVRDKTLLVKEMPNQNECDLYFGGILAPLKSQFFKWVREKYDIDREIYINHEMGVKFYHYLILQLNEYIIEWKSKNLIRFETYEQAEDFCINKIIEMLKDKQ